MKKTKFICASLIGLLMAGGVQAQTQAQEPANTNTNAAADTSAVTTTSLTDGQIARIVHLADDSEIDAAKVAKSHATDPKVKDFAKYMIQEHKKNMKDAKSLAHKEKVKPQDSDMAKNLEKDSKDVMNELRNTNGTNFDKVYINHQVAMHQRVLDDLNKNLIPAAQDAQFKAFLEKTRDHVQEHLSKAQEIQTSLTK